MIELIIIADDPMGVCAVEMICGEVKYVESFTDWATLINALSSYFPGYVTVRIR